MSDNTHSSDSASENSASSFNADTDYRPDVWPQGSRYIVNGALAMILVFASGYFFTLWSDMGPWSIVSGVLCLVAAAYVFSFSFRLK